MYRSSCWKVFCKKEVLKNFTKLTGKHLCWSLFKKEALTQVFSCEFCEVFKNTFFYRAPPVAASECNEEILESCFEMQEDLENVLENNFKIHQKIF